MLKFTLLHNQSDVITVIFGITAGILTVVGLVSVFVSINSQHRAEKARELYWKIITLPYKYENYKNEIISKEIYHLYRLYETILNSDEKFTGEINRFIKSTIITVSIIWIVMILLLMQTFYIIEYIFIFISTIAIIILLNKFFIFIDTLNDISKLVSLPKPQTLIDGANEKCELQIMSLAGMAMRILILKHKDIYKISVGFPIPFDNITLKPTICGYMKNQDDLPEFLFFDYETCYHIKKEKYKWKLGDTLYWFDLCEFKIIENLEKIHIQIDVNSAQGCTIVHYCFLVDKIKSLSVTEGYSELPNSSDDVFVKTRGEYNI